MALLYYGLRDKTVSEKDIFAAPRTRLVTNSGKAVYWTLVQ